MATRKKASARAPASGRGPAAPPTHVRVRRNNADDAQRMRESLVAAALRLFTEGGVNAISMRAVAAQVGVSPMAPYRYFADKADLLSGLWQDILVDFQRALKEAVARHRDPRERERAADRAIIDYWESHPEERQLVYVTQGTPQRPGAIAPVYRELLDLFTRLSVDLARHVGGDERNAVLANEMRMTMGLGYISALYNRRFPWSEPARLRETYIEQMLLAVEHCLRHGSAGTSARSRASRADTTTGTV